MDGEAERERERERSDAYLVCVWLVQKLTCNEMRAGTSKKKAKHQAARAVLKLIDGVDYHFFCDQYTPPPPSYFLFPIRLRRLNRQ